MNALIASLPVAEREADELDRRGFIVLAPQLGLDELGRLRAAYDHAVAHAASEDISISRSAENVRVRDLVSCGPEFDPFYVAPQVLALTCHVLKVPFKLSSMIARTVLPGARSQELHPDWRRDDLREPKLVGFIVPLDDFCADNGATRFVPGSHRLGISPDGVMADTRGPHADEVLALAPSGGCILYDGRVWHGYTANRSGRPRRAIQGAFIPRHEEASVDQRQRLTASTRARISALGRYILAAE